MRRARSIGVMIGLPGLLLNPFVAWSQAPAPPEWPLHIDGARAPIVLYQPQPETFDGNQLKARAAVSIQPPGKDPVFGAVWIEARLAIDREARLVEVEDVAVTRARFTGATPEQEEVLAKILSDELTRRHFVLSLDRFLVSLENAKKEMASAENLKTDPPTIYVEHADAVLLLLDGEPQLRPMADSSDERVVNTPYPLIVTKEKEWRLQVKDRWLTAASLEGPWRDDKNPSAAVPKIIVSKEPAELIVSKGEPAYAPLPGNDLLYMSNTESDVLVETATSKMFVLLSGRWFTAAHLTGPWTFVRPDQLPAAFAKIPPASAKGAVLSSVTGTEQAKEASIDAQIPQTTVVTRKDKDGKLQVIWDGDPQFKEIEGLSVAYSVNASAPVFRVGQEGYWVCDEGIWYAAKAPTGPWVVASYVPKEIYKIPPSCPYYNCRYVHIFESHADVVYVGYYPGYVGCYPYYGTVFYGTGYYYHGWYGPIYYYPPPMMTWGFAFRYNPYSGWGAGVVWGAGGGGWVIAGGGGAVGGWWGPGGFPGRYPRGDHVTPHDGNRAASKEASAHRHNNVYADRDGNVSCRTADGKWQERSGNQWKDTPRPKQDVQKDSQARDRGAQRAAQYQNTSRPAYSGSAMRGGGMRGGGRR